MNALLGNFEIAVIGLDILFRYVLGDDLVRNVPARRNKVASCPQVAPPERLVQRPEVRMSRFELRPLMAFMTRLGDNVGGTLSNKCTWSGRMCPCRISISRALQTSRITSRKCCPTSPRRIGLRYFGMKTKW